MAVPVLWRTQKQRYSLQAEVCPHCSSAVFPSRSVCPYCRQPMAAEVHEENASQSDALFAPAFPRMPAQVAGAAVVVAGDD